MKKVYLYCDPNSLNDATNYYVGIISKCLQGQGFSVETIHHIADAKNAEIIITITEKYFLKAKLRYPLTKTIYWAQGINAEEARMNVDTLIKYLRYRFRRFAEPIAIRKSDILFCVSESMVQYYKEEYGLVDKGQIIVMPCYNLPLSDKFDIKQYQTPTFAYAGNTSLWQGVDLMLDVYALVEKQIPKSCLKIYSGNKDEFIQKCKARDIKNFEIKYVPVDQLQDELHNCKYGFIIRNNHIVNLVATPTKMNSYLAAYMIPIFSDGVDDFKRNINLGEFSLMAKCPLNVDDIAAKIIHFERSVHDFESYKSIVKNVFENHYSDSKYNKIIIEKIINLGQ